MGKSFDPRDSEVLKDAISEYTDSVTAILKEKENDLIHLRVRLRNIYNASGANCFVCKHLKDIPDKRCSQCENHEHFDFMF